MNNNQYNVMENTTKVTLELNLAAEKIMHQVVIHNEQISDSIKNGIENCIKNFDFETEVSNQVQGFIKQQIKDFVWKSELKKLIEQRMNKVIDDLIQKDISIYQNK